MSLTQIPPRAAQPAGELYSERWSRVFQSGHTWCGFSCGLWTGQPDLPAHGPMILVAAPETAAAA